jgi:ABC-2 type transport system ATP-binding protein
MQLSSQSAGDNEARAAEASQRAAPPPVIVAQQVQKSFGSGPVLHDLSIVIEAGEIFGLIGPSGSGKSTTVHLLCGHLRPSGGALRVLGEEPARFRAATRRRIGYMPQQFTLFDDLSAEHNLQFLAGLYGVSPARRRERIGALLELVELSQARKRPARALSGGMQRRLALAGALVHDPDLLFADEPTANLDPILRGTIWRHFHQRSAAGRTLCITTQYIDEAEHCDRVGLMYGGALIAVGKPAALRRQAFGGDLVDIVLESPSPRYVPTLAAVEGVQVTEQAPQRPLRLVVDSADRAIPALLEALAATDAAVTSVAQYQPSFDEVFVRLIAQHQAAQGDQQARQSGAS